MARGIKNLNPREVYIINYIDINRCDAMHWRRSNKENYASTSRATNSRGMTPSPFSRALPAALLTIHQIPLDVIRQRMGEDAGKMYDWLDRVGYTVDRAALRREFPDVAFHDFESWAKKQDWNALLS